MLRAIDVSNFFITLFNSFEEDNDLTNMKINKLLYFAQGHSYERFNRALFNDTIEAWANGPVINSVYQNLKYNEGHTISKTIGEYNQDIFSDEITELLLDIAREYGKYSAATLSNATHQEGTPWKTYFDGHYHTKIPQEAIADYFMNGKRLPKFTIDANTEVIGRTENNCLIISKEDFDDWDY